MLPRDLNGTMMIVGRSPRLLYCTDTYLPQVNGVSVVTALSVDGMRERGWEVAVVAPAYEETAEAPYATDVIAGIANVRFPPYPDNRLAAPDYGKVAKAMDRFAPDLVHSTTEFMIGRLGQIAARRRRIPLVSSYHTDFGRYTASYGVPWLRGTVNRYIARFHRRALRTYTPSAPARDDLMGMGVTSGEVWGRGVDIDCFSPKRRSTFVRNAYDVNDRIVFLHIGRLAAEKSIGDLLDGYRLATERLPARSIHLIVAGTGPEERALRAKAIPEVTFLGLLDRQRTLPQLYASADAFLFASLTETLGLVVLEAMASGVPVIAPAAGGVADHLRDRVNGIVVPPANPAAMADAIVEIALDTHQRKRLAAGARKTAEALSWDAELDRLDASYRNVCETAGAARSIPSGPEPLRPTMPTA